MGSTFEQLSWLPLENEQFVIFIICVWNVDYVKKSSSIASSMWGKYFDATNVSLKLSKLEWIKID